MTARRPRSLLRGSFAPAKLPTRPRGRARALLLDLGGVVLRLRPRACFEYWADRAGVDIEDIGPRWGIDDAYRAHEVGALDFTAYTERLGAKLGIELAERDWRTGWNALFSGTFADVVDALPRAAARIPTYCFTNTNAEHQQTWQTRYGHALTSFRKIYVSSEIGRRKPDVASFVWVAADMGVTPADILFLDDSRQNVEGAASAGMQTVHVTGPEVTLDVLNKVAA